MSQDVLNSNEKTLESPSLSNQFVDVLLLLSGGIDSTACAHYYASRGYHLTALFVDYGQPESAQEKVAASSICEHYKISLRTLAVSGCKISDGYVRARNAFLLSLALMNFEYTVGIVAIGIHSGTPYIDCSPEFTSAMDAVFSLYEEGRVRIDVPFLGWTKRDIWTYATMNGVPLHLTWSSNPDDLICIEEQGNLPCETHNACS